jgi:hypothetical protein
MFGDHSHRIASGAADARGATTAVPDDVGHAVLLVLVAVLSLIALLVVLARLEPPKDVQGVARRRDSTPLEHGRREPGTPPQRV